MIFLRLEIEMTLNSINKRKRKRVVLQGRWIKKKSLVHHRELTTEKPYTQGQPGIDKKKLMHFFIKNKLNKNLNKTFENVI